MYFRHETFRKFQKQFIDDINKTIETKSVLLAEAPTGMGKTDAVISGTLDFVIDEGLTLLFLTPKISQHKIVLDVVEGINKKYNLNIKVTDMVGRKYLCIHPFLEQSDSDTFYPVCEKLRAKEMCDFYKRAIDKNNEEIILGLNGYGDHKNVYELGKEHNFCPYEIITMFAKKANIIIADYFHLFIPKIRQSFLSKIRKDLDTSIVVVDEAHNLPNRLRSQMSSTINTYLIKKIRKELKQLNYDDLNLQPIFKKFVKKEGESLLSIYDFKEYLETEYGLNFLKDFTKEAGFDYVERTNNRSALLKAYRFFEQLDEIENSILIGKKNDKFISISKRSLDPGLYSQTILNNAYASILMSGTLRPLTMYKDILGINRKTYLKMYPSPFPEENRLFIITRGVSTKYTKRDVKQYKKYANMLNKIVNEVKEKVAVFFPSYEVMYGIAPFVKFKYLMQKEGMNPREIYNLIKQFKESKGILFGVQGGSLSEGVDFNNNEIKVVVVLGVSLEKMSVEVQSLIDFYESKFHKGWQYAYIYPAIIKALQSAGRAIRKEKDRAAIILMDERFNWKNYKQLLPKSKYIITTEPWIYVKSFFNS